MPDNEEMARDLTVIYLQKHIDENVSKEDLIKNYNETYKSFISLLSEPPSKVVFHDRSEFF